MNTEQTETPLSCWAYVEIMGHSKIAGRISERKIGPNAMIQVDVPKGETEFAFSRLFNPTALFSITPVDEAYCRAWAKQATAMSMEPVPYISTPRLAVTSASESEPEDDDDGMEDENEYRDGRD